MDLIRLGAWHRPSFKRIDGNRWELESTAQAGGEAQQDQQRQGRTLVGLAMAGGMYVGWT